MAGDFTYGGNSTTWTLNDFTVTSGTTDNNWYTSPTTITTDTITIEPNTNTFTTFEWIDPEKDTLKAENDLLKKTVQSLLELYCGGKEDE